MSNEIPGVCHGLLPGQQLPEQTFVVTRADLVRYAGAAGDFNPIHYSERIARAAGLPGVVAHGMFTMALGARAVHAWVDAAVTVLEYNVRFAKPVIVPDDETGVRVMVSGTVKSVAEDGSTLIMLTVTSNDQKVLSQARATVRQNNDRIHHG
ncbi:MAG: dehydratase [Acidimicrobiales bacterium]|nr:MAG: dehydratase [Acidimicrobiales bacterium]